MTDYILEFIEDDVKIMTEKAKENLLSALKNESSLNMLLPDWIKIGAAKNLFPQYTEKLFQFVMQNSDEYLWNLRKLTQAVLIFPQYTNVLFEFMLKNSKIFLNYVRDIRLAIETFPQQISTIRYFVFYNSDNFLSTIHAIKAAIEMFPECSDVLQKKSIDAITSISFNNEELIKNTINKVQTAVKEFISSQEIAKNAYLIAQANRDTAPEKKDEKFKFFRMLPPEIGVKVAGLTAVVAHPEGKPQPEEIAEEGFRRLGVSLR